VIRTTDTRWITHSCTAEGMLSLRQLMHAAPDLAAYPVQIIHPSSRRLRTLAYSPPSDLGYITRAVQSILKSEPAVRIGHGAMNALDHLHGIDSNLQAFWGTDVGPNQMHKRARKTV
jgi:hypothetical protein